MIDRLPDLHALIGHQNLQMQPKKQSDFLSRIKVAQSILQTVHENNREILNLRDIFVKTTSSDQEAQINGQLRDLVSVSDQHLSIVRGTVQALAPLVKEAEKDPNEVESRMNITMHATLVKQFQEALGESEKCQEAYNHAAKNKTEKQLRMMDPNVTDEIIESCMANPHMAQEIIQAKICLLYTSDAADE